MYTLTLVIRKQLKVISNQVTKYFYHHRLLKLLLYIILGQYCLPFDIMTELSVIDVSCIHNCCPLLFDIHTKEGTGYMNP